LGFFVGENKIMKGSGEGGWGGGGGRGSGEEWLVEIIRMD
jgi:hypothetical protein